MDALRYPIGKLQAVPSPSSQDRQVWIGQVRQVPAELRQAVQGLDPAQLDTPYRDGGWTVRQLVHHVADSHLNAYTRARLALTEEEPTIKPYDEAGWAELADARTEPVEVSLRLLDALHHRLSALLDSLGAEEWRRTLRHPELGVMSLDHLLQLYAWHGRHHVAHVTSLRERMAWR